MPLLFHSSYWKAFGNPIYLETGLLHGNSLFTATKTKLFNKYISIEISEKHVSDFLKKNPHSSSIKVIHGNSKDLAKYIEPINQSITFFLDAHDDQRFTDVLAKVHNDPGIGCPILNELDAIFKHSTKFSLQHKILIDDMQCFKKGFSHPQHTWFNDINFNQIVNKIKELFPNYSIYLLDSFRPGDLLVAIPEATTIPKILHMTYKDETSLPELFKKS